MNRQTIIQNSKHWVIKLGSNVFLRNPTQVDRTTFAALVEGIDALVAQGIRVTLVSSGAVALGRQSLGLEPDKIVDIPRLQAFAALGQSRLMQMYETEFSHYGKKVAQILFSRADLDNRQRFLNARQALHTLHELGAIAIINENDSVATEELRFGDNDQLAAMTCGVAQADLLVILSDVNGIYDVYQDPSTQQRKFGDKIEVIDVDDSHLDEIAGPPDSGVGTGGMQTKVLAARIAGRLGISTLVAPGKQRGVLQALAAGEPMGTVIYASERANKNGKKVWLGTGARAVGTLHCDSGAKKAVQQSGASLLPSGITAVEGTFAEGSVVEISGPDGQVIARGVTVYSADDIRKVAGRQSEAIESTLGYRILDCIVHRDNLIVL